MNRDTLPEGQALAQHDSPQLHVVALDELHPGDRDEGSAPLSDHLGLFGSVKAKVTAQVGHTEARIGELLELKAGAVLTLDRKVGSPIDLWVEGRLIARGHLSVVGEHFAVLVSEVLRPGSR